MQKFGCTILFLLLFQLGINAQNTAYYTVLVGTFLDAKAQDFENLRKLGFLYTTQLDGNLTQVFIGGYSKEASAKEVASNVRKVGYTSASVQQRLIEEGRNTTVIQLGIRRTDKEIKWEEFYEAGDLFVILNDNQVKIVTGLYPSIDAAKKDLSRVRGLGFDDAFVKKVNDIFLHRVSSFEAGGLKRPLFDLVIEDDPKKQDRTTRNDVPNAYSDVTVKSPVRNNPTPPTTQKSVPASYGTESVLPNIRTKVKRRSALELQKVLKAQGTYTSSLDGYYGKGTTAAYDKVLKENRDLQKYMLLSQNLNSYGISGTESDLQNIVNNLIDDPTAPNRLERYSSPIANAYKAYLLFTTLGSSNEVNDLMNRAIREAFEGKKLENQPPFNFRATYAYEDLEQLILHIHYVHSAPGTNLAAPCWLFQMHPKETARAYASYSNNASENFQLQACDEFMYWPEIRMAYTIAADLNPNKKIDQSEVAAAAADRAAIFLAPDALDSKDKKAAESWNRKIWDGLNSWASRDAMHERLVTSFKVAYFQSQVRLEDYYMDKGFKSAEAEDLALATLKTIVGPHMKRFD